jgi:hypothetical protein
MGRDNQPKERQRNLLERKKQAQRARCARILIVSEGSKTEPNYFDEIRIALRLPAANIAVVPGALGTEPLQVAQYARQVFEQGDLHKGFDRRAFDQVFAVFDRDEHKTYFNALDLAQSLDGRLKNDENRLVPFKAVASIPCFELWLLLHFEDIQAPLHRDEVMVRLKQHLHGYVKGAEGIFAATRDRLETAMQRAQVLAGQFNAHTEPEPYTAIAELVAVLTQLLDLTA